MKHTSLLLLIFTTFLAISCTKNEQKKSPYERSTIEGLSQKNSIERSTSLSNVSYVFNIDLSNAQKSETYTGSSLIAFNFLKSKFKPQYLTVDFKDGKALEVYTNGKRLANFISNKNFISIPVDALEENSNTIKINFSQNFSKTGSGLYKFKDLTDQRTYVYTDFEPYDANLFAPIFDQPNLKANYTLNVKAPATWTVISSVMEQLSKQDGKYRNWSFPKSQKFSTYIFSLHGGPYKVWEDKAKLQSKEIPLRLFARQSIAKHVKPDFWFKSTKQGFNFFEKYFQTEYPYTKYDQVIVPDFNSGAMENVAAVTFNEGFVSRDDNPLRAQRRGLSNVIFHEMAHMWFGNLVTMDWWNDLWLNESFATYMAYSGLYYNTEYKESWLHFFNRTKNWAYAEDQWRTTHPIEAEIPSTSVATSNFDGITYGKGASSLKQLVFLIGEDNFKKGLADYFKKFAESNTVRADFINALQQHTKEDLNQWTSEWLQTKGLNSIRTETICQKQQLKEIIFNQDVVSGDQKLRTHKLQVALWSGDSASEPNKVFSTKVSGAKTTWTPSESMRCPDAVFANWNDHAFVQLLLENKSFEYFSKNINKINSKLFRSQFWAVLRNMLRFGKISPKKVFNIIYKQVLIEKDADTLNAVFNLLYTNNKNLFYYYKNEKEASTDRKKLSKLLKDNISKMPSLDLKKRFFNSWVYNTYQDNPSALHKCLIKSCSFDLGFDLNIDKKWTIASALSAVRYKDMSYITQLSKEDPSRKGNLNALSAKVRFAKDKNTWLAKALDHKSELALKERNVIIGNLIPFAQRSEYFKFKQDSFFKHIGDISNLPDRVQKSFAYNFSPLFCGDYSKNIPLTEAQVQGSNWSFGVKKALLQEIDVEERCLKVKALHGGNDKSSEEK